jgi:glutaminase
MNYKEIIDSIYNSTKNLKDNGKLAAYIPELANIDPNKFGVYITKVNRFEYGTGDFEERFSIQSIAKVLTLTLAYKTFGEELWKRVDVEPSGTPFNSLTQLESDKGIPRNPFMNAGALVICDILVSHLEHPKQDFLDFCRDVTANEHLNYNQRVVASEKSVGFTNVALCNFIKSFGNIHNSVEEVLDFYFSICSLEMSCKELSRAFLYLADNNYRTPTHQHVLQLSQARRINAIMQTCGFYDESGEFCYRVGLPGKSGVGGGIVALSPGQYCIAVWSPKLNPKGNSFKSMHFLEEFTTATDSSIF